MKQGLSLRVSQHLALTPQLQQSIRLLQLSTLELSQEVEQMLDENPFLELTEDRAEREDFGLNAADATVSEGDRLSESGETDYAPNSIADYATSTSASSTNDEESTPLSSSDEPNWEGDGTTEMTPDDGEWGVDAKAKANNLGDDEEKDATELARSAESLQAFLHRQALSLRTTATDAAALRFLIESLNDDGYLEDPLEELARSLNPGDEEQLQDLVHHFTVALGLLHSLEPVGVGARDLGECLRLQVAHLLQLADEEGEVDRTEVLQVALGICNKPMDLLARRDIKRLVQMGVGSDALVREAIALIARLEPKPGRRFVDVERNIVVPDVLVMAIGKVGGTPKFRVQLNPEVMPRLKVHDIYANVLRNHRGGRDGAGHAALQQRLQEARWFIKNIQQRFDTILRVSTAIVERQKNFFTHGELAMRPLVLREIADELGLHESTISRVTTAKYMATPFGTFELKYFFGSGLGTESGGNASSTAVRALIKQFIASESSKKPLSDNQISDMLKEQGIECARRTVAKYREGLKIAPASLRKAL
ncbi:MAG: RNA polymerase sigma-54 factor [Curvibacter sp. RIFCSPHIGHO2_12_FULL_63_18]|uniref:RNA polymerase factor sigma-54 n=1 Tax=Rhodoferax sp. TaxID=50421 RepID=UPI0008C66CE7|nr:RNA polymerase factor sigma-54 [Rhodoferax sp.]OGO97263.1 MAG: RNA polymerase sigma-54 factor [Curvibacter sp. GWA2_63_95]OGP02445.1 MAG: RNA polymerase sigma-54 factor [Curvibacter sp. RIFCSPHIGHO2_12_FULL_63_18]HCX81689.1 RNA polymerase sigma-54 factor [Rhodoferax sp.]